MKIFKRFAFAAWLTIAAASLLGTQRLATTEKISKSNQPAAVAGEASESSTTLRLRTGLQLRRRVFHNQHLLRAAAAVPTNSTLCSAGTPYFSAVPLYTNKVQFGYANLMFKPALRVTANVGYNLTSSAGFTPTLADPTILTSLGFNYHKPSAEVDVNVVKGLTWKTAW